MVGNAHEVVDFDSKIWYYNSGVCDYMCAKYLDSQVTWEKSQLNIAELDTCKIYYEAGIDLIWGTNHHISDGKSCTDYVLDSIQDKKDEDLFISSTSESNQKYCRSGYTNSFSNYFGDKADKSNVTVFNEKCSEMEMVNFPSTSNSSAEPDSEIRNTELPAIVGGSAAGLIVIIIIVTTWCFKTNKYTCCKRNSMVIEENEMYGKVTDYYQYDKDAYDTKIVDNNYIYEDGERDYDYE